MVLKKNIKIYTTENCGYCKKAKALLNLYNADYKELVIKNEKERNIMTTFSGGKRTVPQIFINDLNIGGYDEIYSLHKNGDLKKLLIWAIGRK